ncbi:ATP-binding cassette domain-containing protein [Clavibacter zhangzhiyongii]
MHALLGPNGSGKTTAIDVLTATRRPGRGTGARARPRRASRRAHGGRSSR